MNRVRLTGFALLSGALLASAAGCSGDYSRVECIVTLNGQPVEGASVTFVPENESKGGPSATGMTDANGIVKMSTGDKAGVLKGRYRVTVVKNEAMSGMEGMDPTEAMKKMAGMPQGGKGPPRDVGKIRPGKQLTPSEYNSVDQTPFVVDVPTSGQVKLEMEGQAPPEPRK